MSAGQVPSYGAYLRLDQLLSLQGGLEGSDTSLQPDELHFIIVHQVFELWFKLMLRELRLARTQLAQGRVPEEAIPHVVHHLGRTNEILTLCASQFRIMETLTPQDFLTFRDKLIPASGFQSFQMREIEILLGLQDADRTIEGGIDPMAALRGQKDTHDAGRFAWARVEATRQETSLRTALRTWLYRTPIQGSSPGDPGDSQTVSEFVDAYLEAMASAQKSQAGLLSNALGTSSAETQARLDAGLQGASDFLHAEDLPEADRERVRRTRAGLLFIESYRKLPLLAWPRLLVDAVVELEETLVLFRTRHARMVERVIGRRIGTGGSSGVDYLDQTTRYRIFKELWTVRTILLPLTALPPLESPEFYGFAS